MKKTILILGIIIIGTLITVWNACETDSKETCQQDEICTDKFVTACCTDNDCVYKYNGKEYAESEIDQLATELGCSAKKSTGENDDLSGVIERLKALMDRVHEEVNAKK